MAFRYPEHYTLNPEHHDGVRDAAVERLARAYGVLEEALAPGPFLLGNEYSACDAYLCMLTWWCERLPEPPSQLPKVRRAVRQIAARPATARACAAEGIELRFAD